MNVESIGIRLVVTYYFNGVFADNIVKASLNKQLLYNCKVLFVHFTK